MLRDSALQSTHCFYDESKGEYGAPVQAWGEKERHCDYDIQEP